MVFPDDLRYTKTHEWVKVNGNTATVGITEYAQSEISDVVYVELPEVGKEVKKGNQISVVESVKAAFDIYAPLSGKVVEVNVSLEDDPSIVNSDPYGNGWMYKLELSDLSEINELLDSEGYKTEING